MNSVVCDGTWTTDQNGAVLCDGVLQSVPYESLRALFTEFLSPDPLVIGTVSGIALTLWITGVGAGRVVQIMRKT